MKSYIVILLLLLSIYGVAYAGKGSAPMDEEVKNPLIEKPYRY